MGRSLENEDFYHQNTMTETDLQINGRLYTIEYLLTQALAERFRCIDDTQKVEDSARMMGEVAAALASRPSQLGTAALETADRILKKAVFDSAGFP